MAQNEGSVESPGFLQVLFPNFPPIVVTSIFIFVILIIVVALTARRLKIIPSGVQNFFEFIITFWWETGEAMMGDEIKFFFPLFISLFFFILFSNLIGLIPGFSSPTSSLNTTFALASIVFVSTHFFGIKKKGFFGYLKHFWKEGMPRNFFTTFIIKPLIFCIEVIGEIVRPVSLAARLFGNLLAKEIILSVLVLLFLGFLASPDAIGKILSLFPLVMRPVIILLGTLVSIIQAGVFTLLAMVYIAGAVSEEHGH